jgi:PAS domain S-box-containing protein
MEQLTGYDAGSLHGRNLRFLQAEDHDQEGLARIRAALHEGTPCTTTLRNYRRDGTMFWNEVTLVPLRDPEGRVTHFASFHREGGDRLRLDPKDARDPSMSTQTMLAYLRDDKLTGLLRRTYFEELVKRDWGLAQRESRRLSFLVFDLDCYSQYRDVFGRPGAILPPHRARHRRLLPSRQRFVRPVRRGSDRRVDDRARSGPGLEIGRSSAGTRARSRDPSSALIGIALRHCERRRRFAGAAA